MPTRQALRQSEELLPEHVGRLDDLLLAQDAGEVDEVRGEQFARNRSGYRNVTQFVDARVAAALERSRKRCRTC